MAAGATLIERARNARPPQPVLYTGLRGMGKTVVLDRVLQLARTEDGIVLFAEASRQTPVLVSLRESIKKQLRAGESLPKKIVRAFDGLLAVLPRAKYELPHDMGSVSLEPPPEERDDQPIASSLAELNEEVRRAGRFLAIGIDEIQEGQSYDLDAIIRLTHETNRTEEPIMLIGAGLPSARQHLYDIRTYTERYHYVELSYLTPDETREAIVAPASALGVTIEERALELLVNASRGYPFFIQEFASAAWLAHRGDSITESDARSAIVTMREQLEASFYEPSFRRLSPREVMYVLAMQQLGDGPHTAGEVAGALGVRSDQVSSVRQRLAEKDVIFSPSPGMVEFRMPLTEEYIESHRNDLERRAQQSSFSPLIASERPQKRGR